MIDLEAVKKWYADGRIVTIDAERYYEAMSETRADKICAAHNEEVALYLSEIEALRKVAEAAKTLLSRNDLSDKYGYCIDCDNTYGENHSTDCAVAWLNKALRDAGYGGWE